MLIILKELKDSKDHWFEIELLENNGGPKLNLKTSKEIIDYINDLDREEKISYYNLNLDYNNKKYGNIRSLEDLISSISENRSVVRN